MCFLAAVACATHLWCHMGCEQAGGCYTFDWLELCSFHSSTPNPFAASDSFCTATQECLTRISHVANRATGRMHCAHALFSIAAAASNPTARELFDKLRRAYNLMALHGSITVPVLDEWRGISAICDKVACG